MKTLKLIAALQFGMILLNNANAQEQNLMNSDYKCWIYADTNNVLSSRIGVIYSVADSGINYAPLKHGKIIMSDNVQFMMADKIDKINVRKSGNSAIGILAGFGIGFLIGGLIGYAQGDDEPGYISVSAEGKAVVLGHILSLPGMILGGIVGSWRVTIPINRNQNNYLMQQERIKKYAIKKN